MADKEGLFPQASGPNMDHNFLAGSDEPWRPMGLTKNASESEADLHADFISVLANARELKIDFLPIIWQPALGKV